MSPRWVLGVAGSHNGAACLMRDGVVVAAIQEERLTRKKRARLVPGSPSRAVAAVLAEGGLAPGDLDMVAVAPLPSPDAPGMDIRDAPGFEAVPMVDVPHHLAHAASAALWSGWRDAAVLVVDGAGSDVTALTAAEKACLRPDATVGRERMSIYDLDGGVLRPRVKDFAPPQVAPRGVVPALGPFQSAGLMYQAVAQYLFGDWDSAGKVMGLAPFGALSGVSSSNALYPIDAFWRETADGVVYEDGLGGISSRVTAAFRAAPAGRIPNLDRHPEACRLAASVQRALEALLLHHVAEAARHASSRRLLLAGGVFLNGVANEAIVQSGVLDQVFIVPAAEDSGTAVGAAALVADGDLDAAEPRVGGAAIPSDSLGPVWPLGALRAAASRAVASGVVTLSEPPPEALAHIVAEAINHGAVVGWFDGRSELGPRALGHRSILYDPRRADTRTKLNFDVKRREAFRPFAPAALASELDAWFDLGRAPGTSPWMLRVVPVRPERRASIPGVVHVDGTARVQSVTAADGAYHDVIAAFAAQTGVPMVVNTSFNVAGEPLVESPEDAVRAFVAMGIDVLVLGPLVLRKS